MNAQQRKFLIEKIQKSVKEKIKAKEELTEKYPSASNYIFKAIMNDTLKIQPHEAILAALKKKALRAKEGENWLSEQRMGAYKETYILLMIDEVVILPEDYREELSRVTEHNRKIRKEIEELYAQLNTIEMRVLLASDKTLQKLINEVDDMGELSLIDTKLRMIGNG